MSEHHVCKRYSLRKLHHFSASKLLGAPFEVKLVDAVDEKYCADCNETAGHIVPKPNELLSVVALLRVCNETKLNGPEVRFLRKSLHMKAKEFAEKIAVSPEHLSRVENGRQALSAQIEKLLRMHVCIEALEFAHPSMISEIKSVPRMNIKPVRSSLHPLEFELSLASAFVEGAGLPPVNDDAKRYKSVDQKAA